MNISTIPFTKAQFNDRMFFYSADGLYLKEIAEHLHLDEQNLYALFPIMGPQEIGNTLSLFQPQDFLSDTCKINLRLKLPVGKDLLEKTIYQLNDRFKNNAEPVIIAFSAQNPKRFNDLFALILNKPNIFKHLRIVIATKLKAQEDDKILSMWLYGFNPFNKKWQKYLNTNRRKIHSIEEQNNHIFENRFGILCFGQDNPHEDALLQKLILKGIRFFEAYVNERIVFDFSLYVEKYGIWLTGGIDTALFFKEIKK